MPSVNEGRANIRLPEGVFYNRVQQFNRDLTIAITRHYQKIHAFEWMNKFVKTQKDFYKSYGGLSILEALSATGIRAVRYAMEVPYISIVVANDIDPKSASIIEENVKLNNVASNVRISCKDAIDVMHEHKEFNKRFNVVDIDPYGTASPFLDSAVQCLHDGGMLCVTSTDMAVLCGSTPGTAMGKYGSLAQKNTAIQETGLRVLLHAIQTTASRHGRVMEPLVSLAIDFYARVFVRLWSSPLGVKSIAAKHAICFTCTGCSATHLQPLGRVIPSNHRFSPCRGPPVGPICSDCGGAFNVWGPIWVGKLHSQSFLASFLTDLGHPPKETASSLSEQGSNCPADVETALMDRTEVKYPCGPALSCQFPPEMTVAQGLTACPPEIEYATIKRIVGMTTVAMEELPNVPFYYIAERLAAVLGCTVPSAFKINSAILNAGYRVSASHAETSSFKTDAPISLLWDIFLACCREDQSSATGSKVSEETSTPDETSSDAGRGDAPGDERRACRSAARTRLLQRPPNEAVDFTPHPLAVPRSKTDGLVRYQVKPEKFWGPKSRPKMRKTTD